MLSESIPTFAETEVGMEYAGLTREQIIRFQAEKRRSGVSQLVGRLDQLRGGVNVGNVDGSGAPPAVDPVEVTS